MCTIRNITDDKHLHDMIVFRKVVVLILYKPFRTLNDEYENDEYEDSVEFLRYVETFYFDYMKYFTFFRRSCHEKIYYDICNFPSIVIFKDSNFYKIVKKEELPDIVKILNNIYYDCLLYDELNYSFDAIRYVIKLWGKITTFFSNMKQRGFIFKKRKKQNFKKI